MALFFFSGVAALLGATALALPSGTAGPPSDGSSSHSMKYFYTGVSGSEIGMPQFVAVGYVDEQPMNHYDSNGKKFLPKVPWVKEAVKDVNQYWDTYTTVMKNSEDVFIENLAILGNRYNQTGGFHTVQRMYGCELRKDGSTGGYIQDAYDGRDYISFDKETLTWTAPDGPAQITKRKWDADSAFNLQNKAYLEEICIEWLQKYLDYGKEELLRREPPVGKVTRKAVGDSQETLICQAHGFYPKEIDANWKKGEDVVDHETFRRNIARNSDGTYHTWLGININSKERDLYRCHLDHASLPEPLVLAFEEPGVNVGVIVGAILGVVAVLLVAGLAVFFLWKRQKKANYEAALTSEKSSDSSIKA